MRLPDPRRSQAVLIGVSTYQSAELPDVPAVRNNLDSLAAALTDPKTGGFAAERCTTLPDPNSVRLTYRIIRDYAEHAEDTLLLYFAGHGLTGTRLGDLYLGLADTDPNELSVSALSFSLIREILLDCSATNRILILDCCFSGRAAREFLAAPRDAILGEVEIAGTYTLASAPPNARALAPPGATHTAFTGELLSLLTNGIPDGPELLTLGTTYRHLRRTMTAKGLPVPGVRGTDTADLLALTRNPAYREPRVEVTTSADPVSEANPADRPAELGLSMRLMIIFAVIALIGVVIMVFFFRDSQSHDPAGSTSPSPSASQAPITADVRKVPIKVRNGGTRVGLANQAANDFQADGWTVTDIGNAESIPMSMVYFRPDTNEEPAARALAAKFTIRAEPRDPSPAEEAPYLLVIVTNDYRGAKP